MKRTTRKLSGPAKDRFLERFVADEPGLALDLASRLTARCSATFTSIRIRRSVRLGLQHKVSAPDASATPRLAPTSQTAPASQPAAPAGDFDPSVFGLVPVFQREGRDGLLGRLAAIPRIDELRLMAKTQQIVLPAELRSGDIEAAILRHAIADAVAKRVADRRAAAG